MSRLLDVDVGYRALREGAVVVAEAHDLVWVEGSDAVAFLQGLVSQDVEAIPVGSVARSFLLGPQGKLVALLWLARGDRRVGVVTDPGFGPVVAETLNRYRIRVRVEITEERRPRFEVWGGGVETVGWVDSGSPVVGLPLGRIGRELRVGSPPGGLARVPAEVALAVRVEEGEPRMGHDVDERTIPQETGLTPEAVSFTKGCYLGQELVARIDSRGHVNRHLRGVVVDGRQVPEEGAELRAGERVVGHLTSPVASPRLGAPIGLALVRREVAPGDRIVVRWAGAEAAAEIRELPIR